jgi:hypothetical protein
LRDEGLEKEMRSSQDGHDKLFIGGKWVTEQTADKIVVISPFTEKPVAEVPAASQGGRRAPLVGGLPQPCCVGSRRSLRLAEPKIHTSAGPDRN